MPDEGQNNVTPTAPRPFQFALWHVFVLMLAVGVFLALVTQLRHVGFILACLLGGIAAGWWFRRPRLIPASITGLVVYVLVYLASWAQLGYAPVMNPGQYRMSEMSLRLLGGWVSAYAEERGEAPDSLSDLPQLQNKGMGIVVENDLWNNPWYYEKTADGFTLASLGRDGKLGGEGWDADLYFDEEWSRSKMRVPFWEFLFKTEASVMVFHVAWIASLAAGAIWFSAQGREPFRAKWHLAGVAGITTAAVLVALFLAAFHVATSNSGH